MSDLDLSPRLDQLYRFLLGKGDVPVVDLYASMMPGLKDARERGERRFGGTLYAQAWIGAYIARLNKRLAAHGLRVEPGLVKRTYRLVAVQ